MTIFNFNDAERELLLELMLEHVITAAVDYTPDKNGDVPVDARARLLLACRITAELHQPTAVLSDVPARPQFDVEPYIRTLTGAEGIDLDKELGPMDPRAFTPRC